MTPFIVDDDRQSAWLVTTIAPTIKASPAAEKTTKTTDSPSNKDSKVTTEVDCAEDISVALEWKLLLPLLVPGTRDPQPDDDRRVVEARCPADEQACLEQGHECVAQTIREAGEEAVTLHSLLKEGVEEKDFWGSGWVVKKANSAEPLDEEKAFNGYIWVPVEICSPKMRFADADTRVRMRRVLDVLRSNYRLAANCSCEVHIHLGRMDGRAWSLATLQRLGSLLWVAEPRLRSIRDPNSPNFDNTYTWGFAMRQRSRLARGLGLGGLVTAPSDFGDIPDRQIINAIRGSTMVPFEEACALAAIWKAASHLELGQLLSGPERKYRRLGCNFSAFGEEDERARRNPRTMEFRMMEGSVDIELVLGWLVICGTIAKTAVVRSDGRFTAALDLLLQTPDERLLSDSEARLSGETAGDRRGREFRELMQALGIREEHYGGFEHKIRCEHC
ncbi:hypothetical protein C8A00DRAFT_46847 [Chaetomidium leptoderma]|uniref:Amidoligase enzyme-domain-containing protein n=1 Tax=Chaetomidium leptoderma TaxID=669021 RepID=A0AAN6VDP3_9PEZI|nr:hypothetical protein C8A00DRAFT_46847 [Chaetomidium leptoderma]